jgi:hypothetical protein
MVFERYRPILALTALVFLLAGCASLGSRRRDERSNVFPDNYRSDLLAALHAYVADPTNIRDAYLSDPVVRQIGNQNRYTACVRFNAKDSDGRYPGSRDIMAVFANGRFDQFVDQTPQPGQQEPTGAALQAKEACAQAEYKPFPELQTLRR